jgi:hypothetical protein
MRIKIQNFTKIDLDNLEAEANVTLIFSIYYGDLEQNIIEDLKKKVVLFFGKNDPIPLVDN